MDPTELTKHLPEIAKATTAVAVSVPFTAIVKRMLGPAADELAEMWRDQVRLYRYERQLKCVEKAEKMAKDAGFTPEAVPPKILFPLLEGASFEDNEDLHTMWAALLANAASSDRNEMVHPAFISTLRQLTPNEALLLNWIYDHPRNRTFDQAFDAPQSYTALAYIYAELIGVLKPDEEGTIHRAWIDRLDFGTCLNSLESAYLIRQESVEGDRCYALTPRGYIFVRACRPPKPKS
jgi:hypothetical protein